MRLTLRTLLAYLDDVLEPSQAKEIGDKLTESSLASSLVSRIREVLRRRRLTAPTLSGPGMGIDPNTVAEYLDNTLPPDGIADVEKICLESDVHLAETAACHQILTLALGEPVDIAQQTRERMYALGPAAKKMALGSANGGGFKTGENGLSFQSVGEILSQAPSQFEAPATQPAASPTPVAIPDYLRPRSNFKHLFGYTTVAVVIIAWGVLMIKDSPFFKRTSPGANAPGNLVAARGDDLEAADDGTPDQGQLAVNPDGAESETAVNDSAKKAGPGSREVTAIELPAPEELDNEPPAVTKKRRVLDGPTPDTEPSVADKVETANKSKTDGDSPPAVIPATPPAKYVSSDGVTLNYVAREERWFMLPRRALIHAGDLLAVPEPYQCALEVDGGKGLITVMGRSVVRVLEPTPAGTFGLEIRRGQFVVKPPSASDNAAPPLRTGVAIAGELWGLESRPGSVVGVQISLMEPTKLEQVFDRNAYVGAFYVSMGSAAVTDPAGTTHEIKGPGWLQLPLRPAAEGEKPTQNSPLLAIPKWMGPQTATTTAQNYARLFERKFTSNDAVELSVPDVAADGNPEIARLATECLGLIEAYGPLVDILHRSQHEEARRSAIAGLRLWLPRDSHNKDGLDNKDLLKAELTKRFPPEEADTVYKLLWGFDADDARNKIVSTQLIEWMGDPEISIRELAFYHVNRLTGKTHDYRPNGPPVQLKSALKSWKQHVNKEGGLLPPLKPAPGT